MISHCTTDLFASQAQTLVNPVNTVGVMGKGLALEFKRRHPAMYREYKALCDRGEIRIGALYLYESPTHWVLNLPTKRHWRHQSHLGWIEQGLQKFVATYQDLGIVSAAFPQLGCGYGGLAWDDVGPLMTRYLDPLPLPIDIHFYGTKVAACDK